VKLPIINIPVRFPKWIFSWILLFCDSWLGFLVFYSSVGSHLNKIEFDPNSIGILFLSIQIFWSILFYTHHLFLGEYTLSRITELIRLIRLVALTIGFFIILVAVGIIPEFILPIIVLKYGIIYGFFTCCDRIILRSIQKWLLTKGIGRENTVIVGVNNRGTKAIHYFLDNQVKGFNLLGFIRLDGETNYVDEKTSVLGHINDIEKIVQKENVSDIVLALEDNQRSLIFSIVQKLDSLPVTVKIIPDLYEVISGIARTQQVSGLPLIDLNFKLNTDYLRIYKPIFDFLLSCLFIIVSLPLWIVIAISIKLDTKGPILYKQKRVGNRKPSFTAFKFRSMTQDAEKQTGPVWADKNDPRITKVGRFLRRFRLDELPQLLNVIKGDMSLVGPRPERPFFVEKLMKEFPFYVRRLKVRPGITGWAQVKHSYDEKIEDVREKLRYDFYYIENVDIWLDFKILLSTLWVMCSGKGQ
jgi:exopolysaccharide biosynthesis polyprenyl glycosylphosphotransferase